MGHRTGIYLTDELEAAWRASGVGLPELVRRGLDAEPPDIAAARLAAEMAVLDIADRLGAALDKMRTELAEDVRVILRDEIRSEVGDAVREALGRYS